MTALLLSAIVLWQFAGATNLPDYGDCLLFSAQIQGATNGVVSLQYSDDLKTWVELYTTPWECGETVTVTDAEDVPHRFYRWILFE